MMGWGLGERPVLFFDNGDSDNDLDSEEEWFLGKFLKFVMPLISNREMRVSISSSPSPSPLRSRSRAKKNLALLKRAMTTTKFELDVKMVANEDGEAALSPLMTEVKVLRTNGRSQHPGRSGKSFQHSGRTGNAGKNKKKAPGLKIAKKVRKEKQKSLS